MMEGMSDRETEKAFEKLMRKNRATDYYNALMGEEEYTPMSVAYFSKENIQIIQNGIRANVHRLKNIIIPSPDVETIKRLMFYNYDKQRPFALGKEKEDIIKMNTAVIKAMVENIASNYEFTEFRNRRMSSLPVNLNYPTMTTSTDHIFIRPTFL